MQRLALVALALVQAVAGRTCSCECCETAAAREEQAVQCSLSPGAPSAPRCDNLCAKSADDHLLETAQSFVDTERFCFAECVPAQEDAEPGTPCHPLALGAHAGRRARPALRIKRPQHREAPVALAREASAGPKGGSEEVDKLLKDAQKQAAKAQEKTIAVQRASYGGIGVVTEAAHVEDDARRAAGFALGVEQQVHKQLEEAKRQAREEAFAVMQEVMPMVQSAARSAAKKKATTGPFSKLEKSQEEQVKATAAAASSGLQPWSEAMQGAEKVRDAYSQRSHELAQAAAAAQQTATALSAEAEQWRQLRSADETKAAQVESKAEQLQEQAKEAMGAAKENEKKAKKYLSIAKSIDESLPAYSRQAEQGAYHAISMVAPDVPAPLPPLVLQQK